MPEEGAIDKPDTPDETPVAPAVTYRPVEEGDIGNAKLKFYKKKADTDEPDLSTPVDAADVTADNMKEYVVENAAAVVESGSAVSGSSHPSAIQIEQGVELANAITSQMKPPNDVGGPSVGGPSVGGRRRSKRRHSKKGSRKSKKGGARKSKKVGRSRKNGSKRHANKKH